MNNQLTKNILSYNNKIKKYNFYSQNKFRKRRNYIISVDNIFNKIKKKVKLKPSKILDNTKITEISTKNGSKEKTNNNTFNTFNNTYNLNNQNSNIYNNTYINIDENNTSEDGIYKINNDINNNIKNISKNNSKNIDINNIDNLNNKSYKYYKEYYSLNDKINELNNTKKKLFLLSSKFYLYNTDKSIINKIRQLKSKNVEEELKKHGLDYNSKKLNLYSDLRRLPTKICFGKGISSMIEDDEDNEIFQNKFLKHLENKNKENQKNKSKYNKLITKGFNSGSKKNINKYDAVFDNKLVINSNSSKYFKKNNNLLSNDTVYPLLNQKKILKNILPKEVDYNTQYTINDVFNEELHPLYRYQKKNITFHSGLISHEIDYLFVKQFSLGKMADKQKDIINRKMDEKFKILLNLFMKENYDKELDKVNFEKNKLLLIKKKLLLEKFENIMKQCMYKFKRMKIDSYTFFKITYNNNITLTDEEGLYFFKAIKDADIDNIKILIKNNYKLALFKDEFGQTALHIAAKRNVFQIILLLISRLADINAQDIYGRTPLMCACENGHLDTICVLLINYADPNIKDSKGNKAIDYVDLVKNIKFQKEMKIKRALEFTRLIRIFNKIMNSEKNFERFVRNGLEYLFKKELDINYEGLLKINDDLLKDEDNKY